MDYPLPLYFVLEYALMSFIASLIVTLCAVFPAWVVAIALAFITLVAIIIVIKAVAFVLDAVPFL